jgi:predicted DNA-binding helix-hairpin-helix protein
MDAIERLKLLSSDMDLEPAEDTGCPRLDAPSSHSEKFVLSQAVLPNGKRIRLLKSLLTSACERNCYYCPFRAGRDFRRATFKPEEFARLFMNLDRSGVAQGVFLSSGVVAGGIHTQDRLLDTADILRRRMGYRGYIHLKIMPGAERSQVEQAMQLADRVSINLEAPNTHRLGLLAPGKLFIDELLQPLRWVEEIRRRHAPDLGWNGRWPSSSTQFVVGAAGESDLELVTTSQNLYRHQRLGRVYYSRFNPIQDTPLEDLPATSPQREHRLYQASFLLRDYGFETEELPFDPSGNLPLDLDPKLAWAKVNLSERPLEINRATRHDLLRVPGIGPKSALAIISARRQKTFKDLSSLYKLGIDAARAAPFILLDGIRPVYQLAFL